MSDMWFVANSAKGYGPFTTAQLGDLRRLGLIEDIDLVWRSGDTTSLLASAVAGESHRVLRPRREGMPLLVWLVFAAIPLGFVGVGMWIASDLGLITNAPKQLEEANAQASSSSTPTPNEATVVTERARVESLAVEESPAASAEPAAAAPPLSSGSLQTAGSTPTITVSAEASDDIVSLFRPERDVVQGRWIREGDSLVSGIGGGTLALPVVPPSQFELVLHVTRLEGRTGFSIGIMRDDLKATVLLDHWEGSGLEAIDRKRRTENGTYLKKKHFTIGRNSEVRMVVDGSSITCSVDGDPVIEWRGDYRRLSPSGIQNEHGSPEGKLCLYSDGKSAHRVSKITLRRLGRSQNPDSKPIDEPLIGVSVSGNVALASRGAAVEGVHRDSGMMLDGRTEGNDGMGKANLHTPIVVTLAETYQLRQVRMNLIPAWLKERGGDKDSYYQYTVEVSSDGKDFQQVADRSTGMHRGWQTIDFTPRPVKAIRIVGTNAFPLPNGIRIAEIQAYCESPN